LVARLTAGRLLAVTAICVVLANLARHYAQPLPESGAAEIASKSVHYFFAYFPLFHVPGFLFGMALGRAFLEWNRAFNRSLASAIFAAAVVLLGGLFSMFGQIDPVFLSDAILIPIYGVIILSATSLNWPIRSLLEQKVLVVAGEASYGLYIIHAPLWFLINVGLSAIGLAAWRGPNLFWFFLPFVIGCSVIAFYRIERPWRIRLKTRLTESLCAIPSGTAQSTIARPLVSGR
jgi:peptidoglycan/LPS O-acetylase OafA/YrhL